MTKMPYRQNFLTITKRTFQTANTRTNFDTLNIYLYTDKVINDVFESIDA
jgi:hypothetical protein